MTQLHGAWPTMVTPFDENNHIDSGAYRAMIQWYLAHRVSGLYANCLSSEMFHLSGAERLQLCGKPYGKRTGACRWQPTATWGARLPSTSTCAGGCTARGSTWSCGDASNFSTMSRIWETVSSMAEGWMLRWKYESRCRALII